TLTVAGGGPVVRLWDVNTGAELDGLGVDVGGGESRRIALLGDGTTLAAGSYRGDVTLWDWDSRRRIAVLDALRGGVNALAFSPDGMLLALARGDGAAAIWDVASAKERGAVRAQGGSLRSVAFSGDGQVLATGGSDGTLRLWDVAQALGRESAFKK